MLCKSLLCDVNTGIYAKRLFKGNAYVQCVVICHIQGIMLTDYANVTYAPGIMLVDYTNVVLICNVMYVPVFMLTGYDNTRLIWNVTFVPSRICHYVSL